MSTDLSTIVPVHNGEATLADALGALVSQRCETRLEILVVDNRSTDRTRKIADEWAAQDARVRVVVANDAANLSYARNVGVREAEAERVAFCDADDIVGEGWVDAMATALATHDLVASRLEWDRLNQSAVRWGFQRDGIGWSLGRPGVVGAGLGCRRALWDALGGNDEAWDDGGEDFEFSYRAHRKLGVVPYFAANAVYHYRSRDQARAVFRQAARNGRAKVRLFREFGTSRATVGAEVARAARSYLWLLIHLPDLVDPEKRLRWSRTAGERAGRVQGCLRYRRLLL